MKPNKNTKEKELLDKYPSYFEPLDDEEKMLAEDLENDVYINIDDDVTKEKYSKIAKDYIKSKESKPITLRANPNVINKIKVKANSYGLNYQTYINMFLKQLADGKFTIEIK